MKCFYDLQCESCGTVVEEYIAYEDIPEMECPQCKKKAMKKMLTTFSTGPSCSIGNTPGPSL